jgi:cytochrome c nitrite reductase small subunit
MKIVATCSVVAALVVFGYLVAESKMLSYLSSEPEVCINCHTMNTHFATWQHSSHREEATCIDCHLPQDSFTRKMYAKARDGYNHSVAMTFGTYGANLRISKNAAVRIQDNCIRCHESLVSQMVENANRYARTSSHVRGGRMCWDCHRGLPHGITRNLSATQQNFVHK